MVFGIWFVICLMKWKIKSKMIYCFFDGNNISLWYGGVFVW